MEFRDATELADMIQDNKVTPEDAVEDAIERIESINDRLNAVITPLYDRARSRAEGELPEGPFEGVPFLLKDLLASMEDAPMAMGSELLDDYVPDHNSYLVDRYQEAGLIILGKTNTPEFGIQPTTEPDRFGPTGNPWDEDRTPGGSSGGSAAAVASGMVPMAHGNDGGGSLRIPGACCGVVGFKPTRGRITFGPDFGDLMGGLVSEHALTRTVRDCARLLDVTRGPAVGDPYWAPEPDRPFAEELGEDPGSLDIALLTEAPTDVDVDSDCRKAAEDVAELCEELGHRTEKVAPNFESDQMQQAFIAVWSAGAAATLEGAALQSGKEPSAEDVEPLTWALYEMGKDISSSDYLLAQTALQRISRTIQEEYFTEYDLWLTPTLAKPPVEHGYFDEPPENPLEGLYKAAEFAPFTPLCNISGQPAVSLPLYWNEDDLPIGVQFVGGFGREDLLFRLASQLEEARPWADRLPPINAF